MIKNAIILYIRMILVLVISLYSSRVVLNILGVEDFGIYNVVGSIVLMLAFLNNTMASSTQRFFSYEIGRKDGSNLNALFSVSLLIYFAFSVIAVFFLELGGMILIQKYLVIPSDRLYEAEVAFHFSLATFIIYIIRTPFISLIIAHEKMLAYSLINIGDVLLKLIFILLIPFLDVSSIIAYSIALFSATLVITCLTWFYYLIVFKNVSFTFFNKYEHFKSVSSFAGWSSLTAIANMGIEQGLNILINIFFGPVLNTARSISLQIKIQISSFISNIQLAVSPQIIKKYASGDIETAHKLVFFTSKLFFFCSLIVCLPFIFFSHDVLRLWLGISPPYASLFTSLLVINLLIDSLSGNIPVAIQAGGKIKAFQIVQGLLLITAVPITFVLFKLGYSVYYSVFVTCVLSFICVIIRVYFYSKIMVVSYWAFLKDVLVRNLASGVSLFLFFYIILLAWSNDLYLYFSGLVFFLFLYVAFVFLFVLLNNEERAMVFSFIRMRINK